jgi:hypothetical protein
VSGQPLDDPSDTLLDPLEPHEIRPCRLGVKTLRLTLATCFPQSLMVKRGSGDKKYDFWYIYNNVTSEMAGEYECDWTKDLDEGNHHLLVMSK